MLQANFSYLSGTWLYIEFPTLSIPIIGYSDADNKNSINPQTLK